LQRAFGLLEILARHPAGLTLGELSMRSRLHKSTVHRLLSSMIALRYVQNRGLYVLTSRMFELGGGVLDGQLPSVKLIRPLLRDLSARTGETAHLCVRDGDEGLRVYRVESPSSTVVQVPDHRFPLYCTAMGKAILAAHPDEEVRAIWDRLEIRAYTPRTITRIGELLNDLRRVRTQGYAVNYGEYIPGVAGVGCVLPGASKMSVSLCCPSDRLNAAKLADMSAAVKELSELATP
jgi:DNA-binding IclR family transcriptional regulator